MLVTLRQSMHHSSPCKVLGIVGSTLQRGMYTNLAFLASWALPAGCPAAGRYLPGSHAASSSVHLHAHHGFGTGNYVSARVSACHSGQPSP